MLTITIDHQTTTVPKGSSILDAARKLNIEIPTLCFLDDIHDFPDLERSTEHRLTSCLLCLVKHQGKMVPACATKVTEGMVIESGTDEVREYRRTALELLLSDHLGDCLAPCQFACPTRLDIPMMLHALAEGNLEKAIHVLKERIAFPAVLGRVCPRPCEKICRRKDCDSPVTICHLKRFVADTDLGNETPYHPPRKERSGKRVAVLGAGASGLTAAYYLTLSGHEVTIFDRAERPGGRLLTWDEDELPPDVLAVELEALLSLPIQCRFEEELSWTRKETWEQLQREYDAVLLASGPLDASEPKPFDWSVTHARVSVVTGTYHVLATDEFSYENVFAAGRLIRGENAMLVRCCADGREVAEVIDRFLHTGAVKPIEAPFSVRQKTLREDELAELRPNGSDAERDEPEDAGTDDFSLEEAAVQAGRCLHCDCRARDNCRLIRFSQQYQARVDRFPGTQLPPLKIERSGNILYEPGKCIKCGICVRITRSAAEPLGLSFVGRGFDVKVGAPFDAAISEALGQVALECCNACPTAALVARAQ